MDNSLGDVDEYGEIYEQLPRSEALARLLTLRNSLGEGETQSETFVPVDALLARWAEWWSSRGFDPAAPGPWALAGQTTFARSIP